MLHPSGIGRETGGDADTGWGTFATGFDAPKVGSLVATDHSLDEPGPSIVEEGIVQFLSSAHLKFS